MWREIYRFAADAEVFLDAQWVRSELEERSYIHSMRGPGGIDALLDELVAWREGRRAAWLRQAEHSSRAASNLAFTREILTQSAPLASVLGAWLQGMSAPGVCEADAYLRIMALHAGEVGVGLPEASRYDRFKGLLRQVGLSVTALEPFELSTISSIDDRGFHLPSLLLAMSRRPDAFGPEIAAVDLAFRSLGIAPCWGVLRDAPGYGMDVTMLDMSRPVVQIKGVDAFVQSRWVVEQYVAIGAPTRRRIERVLGWTLDSLRAWDEFVDDTASRVSSPHAAMARLMQQRAREARLYHQEYRLGTRMLADWFQQATHDPGPLIDALAKSPLVVPGRPDCSPLVTTLIGPAGRMFRVFSDDDLGIMRRWIDSLVNGPVPIAPVPQATVQTPRADSPSSLSTDDAAPSRTPACLRELYFLLQGRAISPRTRHLAERYVRDRLALAARSAHRAGNQLPGTWRAGALQAWLRDQHDRHGLEFERSDPTNMPSREEVIDSTLQLAPLTLIDGSWLQGFTDWRLAASQVGFALFQTYWDELGNGLYTLNHPKIYRDGLREMGIELPPTASRMFAYDPRFREESFRLPVYWLCLGKLPRTCLPEILGMNLAMELSGVGGSYRSARRFLRYYNFSTKFVDLHNTIDNVSTGHSAWAVGAIDAYMREAEGQIQGGASTNWERIRIGYASLALLPSRMQRWRSMLGRRRSAALAEIEEKGPSAADVHHHAPIARIEKGA